MRKKYPLIRRIECLGNLLVCALAALFTGACLIYAILQKNVVEISVPLLGAVLGVITTLLCVKIVREQWFVLGTITMKESQIEMTVGRHIISVDTSRPYSLSFHYFRDTQKLSNPHYQSLQITQNGKSVRSYPQDISDSPPQALPEDIRVMWDEYFRSRITDRVHTSSK